MLKISIIILIALGLYTLFVFYNISSRVKRADNPSIKHTPLTLGTGPELKYIAAGDSTATGIGATESKFSYPSRIAKELSQTNQVIYKNIGVSGARTKDFIKDQLPQIIVFKPNIITISIGANDRTHFRTNEYIYNNLELIVDTLLNQTSATIYLANIPNFGGGKLLPSWYVKIIENRTEELNPKLETFIKKDPNRIPIVPVHNLINADLSADYFHPSNKGYHDWSNLFLKYINE